MPILTFVKRRHLSLLADPLKPESTYPSVSIIVPARDEEKAIEPCLHSLLNLDYPDFEIIAVNDRSSDQTGSIMDRLADRNARLKIIHVNELPEGWVGKNHALHLASQKARGTYILFTDADVVFEKETLRLALSYTLNHAVDHLCLLVKRITSGYWSGAMMLAQMFMMLMFINPLKVSTNSKRFYIGIGQFNLVKKASYLTAGGHTSIRFDILDDFKLGKLMKMSGYHQDFLVSWDLASYRWPDSVWDIAKAQETHTFGSMNYSIVKLICFTTFFLGISLLPYIGLLFFHDLRFWGYVAAVCIIQYTWGFMGIQRGLGWKQTLSFPVSIFLFLWAHWRSAITILWAGGIYWRETFYPLKLVRANRYR
ncbi:MAG: glycosyltransferase [bacterium]|nr:glycosyltransferase [bacterium]